MLIRDRGILLDTPISIFKRNAVYFFDGDSEKVTASVVDEFVSMETDDRDDGESIFSLSFFLSCVI